MSLTTICCDGDHVPGDIAVHAVDCWARYAATGDWILRGLNLHLEAGHAALIRGGNGQGKSTLLKVLGGLLPVDRGSCEVAGGAPHRRCSVVAYLPQQGGTDWRAPATVSDLVSAGRLPHRGWFRRLGAADRERCANAIERMGLADLAQRKLHELSGGQRRRALLARTLAQEARVVLLDEPLNGLDRSARAELAELLGGLIADHALTIVVTSHETQDFPLSFNQLHHLQDGQLIPDEAMV
ncbi:MAG: ATP-binding cassette domain-containing protein [Planctomycetota bacterium]|jgi:ABC-type Mn2+/Zn2+ transport system ATPase subunit|nr:ATP-binding cassette domain-containing protein [Planctomycetota bacterium]